MTPRDAPLLVFDGDCAFCSRVVRFVLDHDRRRTVRFAPREGVTGRAARERHPEFRHVESLLWIDFESGRERVRVKGDAVLALGTYLGGGYGVLARLGRLVPRFIRDPAYALVARHRHHFGASGEACLLLTPDEQTRVLD